MLKPLLVKDILFVFLLVILPIAHPAFAKIDYMITMTEPEHHLAEVQITLPKGQASFELKMPAWRTGNYKIINQANGVRSFQATDDKGKVLNWKKSDKSSWRIDNPSLSAIKVKYQLYANELGRRTRHIDDSHAYLDATAVFMYEPSLMDQVHIVNLQVPKPWKSYSGMVQLEENQFIAQNYHQLADSPIETGLSEYHEFSVDGKGYQLVIWGKGNVDGKKMADDLKVLASQSGTIWKGYPYKKYLFIVHATSGATGATEHMNSTVIQRPRFSFAPHSDYLKYFLRTASHEFVHTWNVKAYRPQGLVPYDYQQENDSDLLWMAEGSTSYFQGRLLLTGKLQKLKEFLKDLSSRIHDFQHKPGRLVQSVSEASLEKWIAQSGDFANNYSVNIYSEGYMASWALDFQMLSDTKLKYGYKDLHGALFEKWKKLEASKFEGSEISRSEKVLPIVYAFNSEDVREQLLQLTRRDYQEWWQNNIRSPLQIDFEALLDKVGLKFKALEEKDHVAWTGFKSKTKDGYITLTQVERNSPAWEAGLTLNDQLIAINALKVTPSDLEHRLKKYKSGNELELTLFRNHQLISKSLVLGKTTKDAREIELIDSPSEAQKAFFKAWTGIDFPEKEKD